MIASSGICVVKEVVLEHASTCSSPAHMTDDDLTSETPVIRALFTAREQKNAIDFVRENYAVELTASGVTRLRDKVVEKVSTQRKTEYKKVVPLLQAMADANAEFGAEVLVKTTGGADVTVLFGLLKPESFAPVSDASLNGARIVHLLVLWPWARRIEALGPPVAGADAMHSKAKQGHMFNLSMRVGKRYVSLLTMWAKTENQAAWGILFRRAREHLKVIMQPGTSVISDRGKALIAALAEFPDVQHLFDRPHLLRNVTFHFPELSQLGDALPTQLDNIFYARTDENWEAALKMLMSEWIKIKNKPEAPATPPDEESDTESPFDANTKPRTYIERKADQTPESYIRSIAQETYCIWKMRFNNYDVPSSNSAEAMGQTFMDARYETPAQAIATMFQAHLRFLAEAVTELDSLRRRKEVLFPSWPFWERFEEETARVPCFKCEMLMEHQAKVEWDGPHHGVHLSAERLVMYDPDAPVANPWQLQARRGHQCGGGCYVPQVRRAPCPHIMCFLRRKFPAYEPGKPGTKHTDAELEARREERGRKYQDALLSVTAPWYQVDWLYERLRALVAPGALVPRSLADVSPGVELRPITEFELPCPITFSGTGRPGEARAPSHGEAALAAASSSSQADGKRFRSGKNSCSVCKARGLPALGHTKKSPACPANVAARAAAAAGAGEAAGAAAVATVAETGAALVDAAAATAADSAVGSVVADAADDSDGSWEEDDDA